MAPNRKHVQDERTTPANNPRTLSYRMRHCCNPGCRNFAVVNGNFCSEECSDEYFGTEIDDYRLFQGM